MCIFSCEYYFSSVIFNSNGPVDNEILLKIKRRVGVVIFFSTLTPNEFYCLVRIRLHWLENSPDFDFTAQETAPIPTPLTRKQPRLRLQWLENSPNSAAVIVSKLQYNIFLFLLIVAKNYLELVK